MTADADPTPLSALPLDARAERVQLVSCRPLTSAKVAIDLALARFHESWTAYRHITPTLYGIGDRAPGVYLTLGRLRGRYGVSWATVDALVELLEARHAVDGYLVAGAAVGGTPARALFALQGHHHGERHYGALDLATLTPFEGVFRSELDVAADAWRDAWAEAASNGGFA